MAKPEPSIPVHVLIAAEEAMRLVKDLPVNAPIPSTLWMQVCHSSAQLTHYKRNVLLNQQLPVRT